MNRKIADFVCAGFGFAIGMTLFKYVTWVLTVLYLVARAQ